VRRQGLLLLGEGAVLEHKQLVREKLNYTVPSNQYPTIVDQGEKPGVKVRHPIKRGGLGMTIPASGGGKKVSFQRGNQMRGLAYKLMAQVRWPKEKSLKSFPENLRGT